MIASIDAPDEQSLQESVSCNDKVAFKIESNVLKFYQNTDSY